MRSCGVFWILPGPFRDGLCGGCRQRRPLEDPRSVGQRVDTFDLAGIGRQSEGLGSNLQEFGSVAEVEPWLDAVCRCLEHWDAVVRAHRGDALAGPAIAVAGLEAVAVEQPCDQIVGGDE